MTPQLYPDQLLAKHDVYAAWAQGYRNVILCMGTGTGKTVTFCDIVRDTLHGTIPNMPQINGGFVVVLAHRSQLVAQASLALAHYDIRHRVIASKDTIKGIVGAHMMLFKRDFTDPRARVAVVSVDTFIGLNPDDPANAWLKQVTLFVPDEAHHVQLDNKWGRASLMLPNAWGLMPTATAGRPDGKGLGRHADGIADALVIGPTAQDRIDRGERSDFTMYAPPTHVDMSGVRTGSTGDYVDEQVRAAVHKKSRELIGDLTAHYEKYSPGLIGLTFAVDVEEAGKITAAYRQAGIPAECITGSTPITLRTKIMRELERGMLKQVVSVDILGEGTDVPAVEVVSMGRPTDSFIVYEQQAGRLRGRGGDSILLDAVGNVLRHGKPGQPRKWSLDRRERRGRSPITDAIPITVCTSCFKPYERIYPKCPHCGSIPVVAPGARSSLAQVDGDLVLVDAPVRSALEAERARIDGVFRPAALMNEAARIAANRYHMERQREQAALRHTMSVWAGWQGLIHGTDERVLQRVFFHRYGTDVLTAQTLNARDAETLRGTLERDMAEHNIVEGPAA
jgi:DNA repair protein RadD